MSRADKGGAHEMTTAGRDNCALAATRHGVYAMAERGLMPRCSTCPKTVQELCPDSSEDGRPCSYLSAYREQMLEVLRSELGDQVLPTDWFLVTEYVKTMGVILRIDQVLEAEGIEIAKVETEAVKPDSPGESYERKTIRRGFHPLMSLRATYQNNALKLAAELGLSPRSRNQLNIKPKKKSKGIMDLGKG